jgi:hypothetical protein
VALKKKKREAWDPASTVSFFQRVYEQIDAINAEEEDRGTSPEQAQAIWPWVMKQMVENGENGGGGGGGGVTPNPACALAWSAVGYGNTLWHWTKGTGFYGADVLSLFFVVCRCFSLFFVVFRCFSLFLFLLRPQWVGGPFGKVLHCFSIVGFGQFRRVCPWGRGRKCRAGHGRRGGGGGRGR